MNFADAAGVVLLIAALGGCISSQVVLVGEPHSAIPPAQVEIYLQPPDAAYQEIANLSASSRGSFAISAAAKMDKVIARLKEAAARVGANGILLHGVSDRTDGALGAGISTETNSPHSPYGLGFGTSVFLVQMAGDATAIYVEPK
jgi:hypothetical protein